MPRLSPVNQARWARFRHNRRGYWSLWIFLIMFSLSLCAELIANDKPLLVRYEGQWYFPLVKITASAISAARWRQRRIIRTPLQRQLENRGWVLWAPYALVPIPLILPPRSLSLPPSAKNWLGTDANGGDVFARILYGTRISILFGLMLTICSSVMGVLAGALQGYYGGKVDLWGNVSSKSGRGCRPCF